MVSAGLDVGIKGVKLEHSGQREVSQILREYFQMLLRSKKTEARYFFEVVSYCNKRGEVSEERASAGVGGKSQSQ